VTFCKETPVKELFTSNYWRCFIFKTQQTAKCKPRNLWACTVKLSFQAFNIFTIYSDAATATTDDTTQNTKCVTCTICVHPIIMFAIQAASNTHLD